MLEFLTGTGLATSAGLNAYIPLLALGLLDRFTGLVDLPAGWTWLAADASLWILGVLLALELVADKIPGVDAVNDAVQTVVRPAAGGIVFASGVGTETTAVHDPGALFAGSGWVPVIIGAGIALAVHLAKAGMRVGANTVTVGAAAPVLSAAEDVSAAGLVAAALFLPVLVAVLVVAVVVGLWLLARRFRDRRTRGRAGASAGGPEWTA
ncbi:DUF4126 domain-containing protein [Micrococcus luteus]|uniref:DUF4126 domain-containing protein n=1 Tax=Micrococcus luteus TaxID=1270 RepID=UPI0038796B55|nr:DUF4126 domain-containing protein [Micrococcus luteus]